MDIVPCIEEEYSLAPAWLWRRPRGWRWFFMYFRGPAGMPFFIAPFLSLAGIWRFYRKPGRLADLEPDFLTGAKIVRVNPLLGSYGMGGPGFFGIRISPAQGRRTWLVFTLWGAAEWLTLDGKPFGCTYRASDEPGKFEDTGGNPFPAMRKLSGFIIESCRLEPRYFELILRRGEETRTLQVLADSPHLPVFRGSKEPRIMDPATDLRDAIVLSRRGNLWLL